MLNGKTAMHYVYILKCSDNSYYTGYSTDVQKRLRTHNEGKGSRITRSKLPAVLVYQEECESKSAALKREAQIKSLTRSEKERIVLTASKLSLREA